MSRKVVTCAALDAHLEAFRVLIGEHSECWHLHSRRPGPRRGVPSGQERAGQSFSARKAASLTGIQSMGCGLRVYGTPRRPMEGLGCQETIISIYHQMLGLLTPGTYGHFGHRPRSTKSRFCIGAADSARWKSCRVITCPRLIEDRQAKEDSDRETCECVFWCRKQKVRTYGWVQNMCWKRRLAHTRVQSQAGRLSGTGQ